ncbi:homocysteine S-methyltransferase YbgG-like, partial [Saccoglossus kowalevskii]|uniref:Homocysteine S-methyltransferase 3-like n=1 Tax=Saccoglossus kowalevskii TaxID=10224 RepID=A0ABM0GVC9_SACKO
ELINWHRETVDVIVNTGIDYLAFETVPALKEAEAIVQLLQEYPSTKAWISFSCKDGEHTCHGEKFSDAVKVAASSPSVVAVGINCTPPQYIKSLLKSSENEIGDKIFVVYPNGASYIGGGLWKKNENNKNLCAYVPDWINAGANWIGGCCMIGSQQIQDIRQAMVDTIAK